MFLVTSDLKLRLPFLRPTALVWSSVGPLQDSLALAHYLCHDHTNPLYVSLMGSIETSSCVTALHFSVIHEGLIGGC
jgi:hypothetical protein